jgi:hypothetical protein
MRPSCLQQSAYLAIVIFVYFHPAYLQVFKPVVQDVIDFFQPAAIVLQVCKPLNVHNMYFHFGF